MRQGGPVFRQGHPGPPVKPAVQTVKCGAHGLGRVLLKLRSAGLADEGAARVDFPEHFGQFVQEASKGLAVHGAEQGQGDVGHQIRRGLVEAPQGFLEKNDGRVQQIRQKGQQQDEFGRIAPQNGVDVPGQGGDLGPHRIGRIAQGAEVGGFDPFEDGGGDGLGQGGGPGSVEVVQAAHQAGQDAAGLPVAEGCPQVLCFLGPFLRSKLRPLFGGGFHFRQQGRDDIRQMVGQAVAPSPVLGGRRAQALGDASGNGAGYALFQRGAAGPESGDFGDQEPYGFAHLPGLNDGLQGGRHGAGGRRPGGSILRTGTGRWLHGCSPITGFTFLPSERHGRPQGVVLPGIDGAPGAYRARSA